MRFTTEVSPLDLDLTLGCGQTFRWKKTDDAWEGPLGRHVFRVRARGRMIEVETEPPGKDARKVIKTYLRADDDIGEIQAELCADPLMARGMRRFEGLRIVKMDEWECIASYTLATYANIPRIMKMVDTLAVRYGEKINDRFSTFPSIDVLARVPARELRKCGLGYRADYIHGLASSMTGTELGRLKRLDYPDLREELLELPGIGEKVADCVSLFGFGKLEAFPIDVWIERALARLYKVKGSYRRLREFASLKFGPFAGYAQEYLYFNERELAGQGACAFSEE